MKADTLELINDSNQENRHDQGCNMYFCIEYYNIWSKNDHFIIKKIVIITVLTGYVSKGNIVNL